MRDLNESGGIGRRREVPREDALALNPAAVVNMHRERLRVATLGLIPLKPKPGLRFCLDHIQRRWDGT